MANRTPTDEEIFEQLDSTFDGLDSERAKGLQRLKTLHTITDDGDSRELIRQKAKNGAEHPRVKKLEERLKYNEGAARELDVEIERAHIKVPPFDLNTWMVHGRVLDKEGKGISGLTVSLYDSQGTWVEELDYVCTVDLGYYAIRYKVDPEKEPEIPDKRELFLTVTDSNFKVLHREIEPLFVIIGQIDFRPIVLDDEGGVCAPPEPGGNQTGGVPPDVWLVRGKVVYESGEPGKDLTVSLYDKDLLFDDVLGTVRTGDDGLFSIIYRIDAFRDLFEAKPDIYLKVMNNKGEILFSSKKKIRAEAGRVENFLIKIKSGKGKPSE
jgi:hypothetical protein